MKTKLLRQIALSCALALVVLHNVYVSEPTPQPPSVISGFYLEGGCHSFDSVRMIYDKSGRLTAIKCTMPGPTVETPKDCSSPKTPGCFANGIDSSP